MFIYDDDYFFFQSQFYWLFCYDWKGRPTFMFIYDDDDYFFFQCWQAVYKCNLIFSHFRKCLIDVKDDRQSFEPRSLIKIKWNTWNEYSLAFVSFEKHGWLYSMSLVPWHRTKSTQFRSWGIQTSRWLPTRETKNRGPYHPCLLERGYRPLITTIVLHLQKCHIKYR